MSRKTATLARRCRHERRLGQQQMDLFRSIPPIDGAPAWPDLPKEAQAALTSLMMQLILDHAGKIVAPCKREAGRDL
jgi:hypothetical protein